MKLPIKKILRKVHLWLGLYSGIVVFIIALTGAIYVFSYEIKDVIYKDSILVEVPENTSKVPLRKLVNTASDVFNNKYSFRSIVIPNFPNHSISVNFIETDDDAFGYHNYMKFYKTVYLNPYTGEVIKIENTKWEFFNVVLALHMSLFMGHNTISHYIVVSSMWIFVTLLITGLILWWPKKKQRKQFFRFKWKKTTNWKRKNYDLHRILGFYVCFIGLILALTGLMWASKSFNNTVKWVSNGGRTIPYKKISKPKNQEHQEYPLNIILNSTLTKFPKSKYILIREHPKPTIPYVVRSYQSSSLNFNRVEMYYDKKTAELLDEIHFKDKNNGEKIQALNYDLHVGTIGGVSTKILFFIVSLLIASLPITGFLIWYGRNYRNRWI